jgi:hypothetical protein
MIKMVQCLRCGLEIPESRAYPVYEDAFYCFRCANETEENRIQSRRKEVWSQIENA